MTRFYRALLRLYPERFREEYGDELCRAFVERTRGRSRLATVAAAIGDVVPNAIAAHWDILRHGSGAGLTWPAFSGDIRYALRQIARAPLLSGVIIAVIAIGIGINAGLLTILDTYVWQPAPGIPRDRSLVRLSATVVEQKGRAHATRLSYPDILDLRARHNAFADVAAWRLTSRDVDMGGGAETMLVSFATSNFFRVLQLPLAAGSGFDDDRDRSSRPIAVISYSHWMTTFGGSPDAIGKTIRVSNQPFTIVGVAPPRFVGIDIRDMDKSMIWLPLGTEEIVEPNAAKDRVDRGAAMFSTFARLAPGVSPAGVARLTSVVAAQLARPRPDNLVRLSIAAEPLTGVAPGDSNRTELVAGFLLIAALIVVITCTNVSALLLGRAAVRRREIGVRLALGATRRRLMRQMLTESLVLAVAGAALALVLYVIVIKVAYANVPELIWGLQAQPSTFAFAGLFALVTTLAFGLAPALHATSADIGDVMKNSGNHAISRSRLQRAFVVVQLACSQPVLVVTSLVLADLRHTANANADQAPASVVTMSARNFRSTPVSDLGEVRRRLAAMPGVRSVGVTTMGYPRPDPRVSTRFGPSTSFDVPGVRGAQRDVHVRQRYVDSGYFATVGVPLLRGRSIGVNDDHEGSVSVVVNDAAAKTFWPGENPIGKLLLRHSSDVEGVEATSLHVIGVVATAAYDADSAATVFAPLSTAASQWESTIALRTSGDARTYVPSIRAAVREADPFVAIDGVITLAEQYAGQQREAVQSNAAAFAVGAAALVLASLGLYAVIAFAVAQRTREIGIRLAMGATRGVVVRQFFRNGIVASAIGLAIGLPLTVAGIRVVQANMLGFTLQHVAAVLVVVPVLVSVAALASWLPARRAGRVDPVIALRTE